MKKQGTIKKDWNVLRNTAYKYSGATQKKPESAPGIKQCP